MEKTVAYSSSKKTRFSLPSPAKVNHFLHIVGRRKDGYHLLQTLFQFLEVFDHLHFELREDNEIVLTPLDMMGIPSSTNLIYRAALALQRTTGTTQGVNIHVEKNLPLGGGLGGGSSNAATTLIALNFLWDLNWSLAQLIALGLTLGADIPIFLHGHAALAEGIGEQLTSIELDEPEILAIVPSCQVATIKMYADPHLTRNTRSFKIGTLIESGIKNTFEELRNDFEPVVRRHYPEVDDAVKWLSNFGKAQLSGSGACVFACFSTKEEMQKVTRHLPPHFKCFMTKGTNKSPLVRAAEKLGFTFNHWGVAKR